MYVAASAAAGFAECSVRSSEHFYGPEIEEKKTFACKIHPSLLQMSHCQTWVTCEID